MTTIKDFEDLKPWRKARELAGYVYTLTRKRTFALDAGYITPDELKQAYDLAVETKKLINGMISYLSKN